MDPSAEKLVSQALRQVVISRALVTGFSTVGVGLKTIGQGFAVLGQGVEMIGNTIFTIEADGARKYETLTGADLGTTVGLPGRYRGIHGTAPEPEREAGQ